MIQRPDTRMEVAISMALERIANNHRQPDAVGPVPEIIRKEMENP